MVIKYKSFQPAFTIVELLVVIVVIGILVAITIVAYTGISSKATVASLTSDLDNAAKQLKLDQVINSAYPATLAEANGNKGIRSSPGTTYQYIVNNSLNPPGFCIAATKSGTSYKITENTSPTIGDCTTYGLVLNLDAGNTASYPGSGNNWTDLSGNGIVATLTNGPLMSAQGATLDGINDFVRIPFNSAFNFTSSPFTVIVWNKTITSSTSYNGIISSDLSGDTNWKIVKVSGQGHYISISGSTGLNFPDYTIGAFHNYAFTKNGSNMINYFDGTQSDSTNAANNPASFSNDLVLGSYRLNDAIAGGWLFNQTIGNVQIYNRALSSTEISQNFNALRSRYGL